MASRALLGRRRSRIGLGLGNRIVAIAAPVMESLLIGHNGRLAGSRVFHARNLRQKFWLLAIPGVTVSADSSHSFGVLIEQVRRQRRRAICRIRRLVQRHLGSLSRRLRRVMTFHTSDRFTEIGAAILGRVLRMIESYLAELGLLCQHDVVGNLALRIRLVDYQAGRDYQQCQEERTSKYISASCSSGMH